MLSELSITNFAIIDALDLSFAPGFNVLTGETGAGKSIIIDAVSLLLGGRSDATMVRTGADAARIEGVFALDSETRETVQPLLEREALGPDDGGDSLTLAREIRREGRNVCRVNGRTVSLAILKEIGQYLVDIHGQSEHLSLLRVREHLYLLDRYASLDAQRGELAAVVRQLNEVRRELDDLIRAEKDAARRIDMLNFQIGEINAAKLKPGEDKTLLEERIRLANAEKLAALADEAIQSAAEGDEASGAPAATDQLGHAVRALHNLARIDPALETYRDTAQSLAEQLAELARDLRSYRESIEFNPKRLDQVEERLDLIKTLQRKYGPAIEDILVFADTAGRDLDAITHAGERIEALRQQEESLLKKIGRLGHALSTSRRGAGEKLAQAIEVELQDLRMEGARFGVDVQWEEADDGAYVNGGKRVAFDHAGIDRIEFLVAPNPGEGFKPLVKIASGGETARLMLALKGVLARADRTPTLIFDEIDQGIGGRVGSVVGRKLWSLALNHQVLCITHLPQLAGFGDAHFKVAKHVNVDRTTTEVQPLEDDARIDEITQMLGTESDAARQSAEELLKRVGAEKLNAADPAQAGRKLKRPTMSIQRIMADLHEVANVGEGVELLNLYKGVPVVNKATFVKFEAESVTLKTMRPQLICLERDRRTIVLSDILQVALSADVSALDPGMETATLAHLAITDKNVGDRMTVRVEPLGAIAVDLKIEDQVMAASLVDISLNGVGLYIPGLDSPPKKKMPVQLTLPLPTGQIEFAGVVRYARAGTGGLRVGVDFSENIRIRAMLAQYINSRRAEILDELGAA